MYELNNTHDKPHKKSARVVGDVIGKFHLMVIRLFMTQLPAWFRSSLRYPLIDGQAILVLLTAILRQLCDTLRETHG